MEYITLLLPAVIAGLLVIFTHVPLGMQVLKRGIIFIDLAIAQIAALGVIIANVGLHMELHESQLIGCFLAIFASIGFMLCERFFTQFQEAIIGSVYVLASCISILILSHHPHGNETANTLLSGQLLWVSWKDIYITIAIYGLLALTLLNSFIRKNGFYIIFAITITLSVQLAGVYLVFATLILPAIGAALYKGNRKLTFAYSCAIIALITGLSLSVKTDLPTGPMLVCVLFATVWLMVAISAIFKRA
jgi:zinc/manganese transport system permease protein